MLEIGKEIKKLMIDKSMKNTYLAEKLNIGRSTLYKKLNGKLDFNRKEINIIISEFNLSEKEVVRIFFDNKVS